jgi:predicted nucleic acid-binding protein
LSSRSRASSPRGGICGFNDARKSTYTLHASEAQQIRKFFESGSVRVLPFNLEAADRYARIRALHRVSPADAVHLAAASLANVDLYITNDDRLKKLLIDGIQFIVGLDGSIF